MKADELRKAVEEEKDKPEGKVVVKDGEFYENRRDEAMESYLKDVGPISEYINKNLDAIAKKSSKEK